MNSLYLEIEIIHEVMGIITSAEQYKYYTNLN